MTAEEIRAKKNEADDGAWQSADWLQEIAAQLAEYNALGKKILEHWDRLYPVQK